MDPDKELNFILNYEQNVIDIVTEIKNKNQINEDIYNKFHPVVKEPGILYGLVKILKKVIDSCPAFPSIFSAIGTLTYIR